AREARHLSQVIDRLTEEARTEGVNEPHRSLVPAQEVNYPRTPVIAGERVGDAPKPDIRRPICIPNGDILGPSFRLIFRKLVVEPYDAAGVKASLEGVEKGGFVSQRAKKV